MGFWVARAAIAATAETAAATAAATAATASAFAIGGRTVGAVVAADSAAAARRRRSEKLVGAERAGRRSVVVGSTAQCSAANFGRSKWRAPHCARRR